MTHSPRSSIGCVSHDLRADGTFDTNRVPFLRQDYHYLQMDLNKLPLEPHRLGVSSGASKMISEPMVRSAQTVHIFTPTITQYPNGPKRDSTGPTHLGVPSVASKTIFEPMVRLAQTAHLSCVKISTISKQTQTRFPLSLITQEYRRVRPKREPMVRSAQTVHQYCIDTNTVSKRIGTRFHMTHSPRTYIGCVQDNF
jgi:hypothetical protein